MNRLFLIRYIWIRKLNLFLISAAMVMNASSTFVEFLALVSKNGIPISSANAFRSNNQSEKQNLCIFHYQLDYHKIGKYNS